jgi:hypothetical protein
MNGAIPPLFHMNSCHALGQLHLCHCGFPYFSVAGCVVCFGRLCIADMFLRIYDSLHARISDNPDDIKMFADDKLHNTFGAIQVEERKTYEWPS